MSLPDNPDPLLSRDAWLILAARWLRTFATAAVAIIIAIYLERIGLTLVDIGAFLAVGLAGSTFFTFLVGLAADVLGRRRVMLVSTLVMAVAGILLAFTTSFPLLCVLAFVGGLGLSGSGPLQPMEQATLAGVVSPRRRTELFAVYLIASTTASALGALSAGLPSLLGRTLGFAELDSMRAILVGYGAFLAVTCALYALLSTRGEVSPKATRWVNPLRLPSRRHIFTLAGLFSVDSFAGGLILQSLVSYWFATKFGLSLGSLGLLFFGSYVLMAIALWVAAWLSKRIGLINTMVLCHLPASLLLVVLPLVPNATIAVILWQIRSFISVMDAPARDSYAMAVVTPEERVATSSITGVAKSVGATLSPSIATLLWQAFSASAPFIASGVIRLAYDLSLFAMFRRIRPLDDPVPTTPAVTSTRTPTPS